jgi:hypothetical protein
MTKWNFTASNGQLIKTLDTTGNTVLPRVETFMQPSFSQNADKIHIMESGSYKSAVVFSTIGTIGGQVPTDMLDAMNMFIQLVPNSAGGGGTNYNAVTEYDTVANLPITFSANNIHSIAIVALTGDLTITVGGEQVVMTEGSSKEITASTLIEQEITIDSCTGTFNVTTLS